MLLRMLENQHKLPEVFHMKPLNNWPNNAAKVINVCQCTCHHQRYAVTKLNSKFSRHFLNLQQKIPRFVEPNQATNAKSKEVKNFTNSGWTCMLFLRTSIAIHIYEQKL